MSELFDKEYKEKLEKLNQDLVTLTLSLQNEVRELKEDTIVNAQHLNALKQKSMTGLNVVNSRLGEHINNVSEMTEVVVDIAQEKEENNYATFLKNLLESDFKALQYEMLEEAKREMLNVKAPQTSKNKFGIVFNVLSIVSFVLIAVICVKYKLLW